MYIYWIHLHKYASLIGHQAIHLPIQNVLNIDRECTDVYIVVRQYDALLSTPLDKHAPSKRIYVVDRPMNDWMTDDILVLEALRRKYESLWRKTRLTVHVDMYSESCMTAFRDRISTRRYQMDNDHVAAHISATKTQSRETQRKGILILTRGNLWRYSEMYGETP